MAHKRGGTTKPHQPGSKSDRCRAIVGIGASAGGIESLGRLFDVMPTDSGCGFAIVDGRGPVGNDDVNPVGLDRHTIGDIDDRHRRVAGEHRRQLALPKRSRRWSRT